MDVLCFGWLADPESVRLLRGSLIVCKRLLGSWQIEMSSRAFCLDGSSLLSLAHGACLTGALTHRRQSLQRKKERKKVAAALLSGSDGPCCMLVVQPPGLLATYSIIFTAHGSSFVPICICFWSGGGSALRFTIGCPCKFREWLVA